MTGYLRKNGERFYALISASWLAMMASGVNAADLPTGNAPSAPAPIVAEVPLGFFVKFGFTYAINTTTSKLYSQQTPIAGAPQVEIPGVGATLANVATLGFESGYFVTPNVSIDASGGIPLFAKVTTKGAFPPGTLPVPSGTRLATVMPAIVPVTVLYHFNQFGRFQPYIGAGVAAVFSFAQRSGFNTGVTVDPTVGLVLQGGADIMLDRHWGWSLDVKKVFAHGETDATGVNLADIGLAGQVPLAGTLKNNFAPWLLSTGLAYRF